MTILDFFWHYKLKEIIDFIIIDILSKSVLNFMGHVQSWISLVIFRGSEFFYRGYFMGPIFFFFVDISWVQFLFVAYFVFQRFLGVGCTRKSDRKQKYINTSQTARVFYSKSISTIIRSVYSRKAPHQLN